MNGDKVKLLEQLTLRDYFAAKALEGYMAGGMKPIELKDRDDGVTPSLVAERAYLYADAMLKERIK